MIENTARPVKNRDTGKPEIKEDGDEKTRRNRSILSKSFSKYTFELYFALVRRTASRRIARRGQRKEIETDSPLCSTNFLPYGE